MACALCGAVPTEQVLAGFLPIALLHNAKVNTFRKYALLSLPDEKSGGENKGGHDGNEKGISWI